jgi:hypothetical protein
MLDQQPLKEVKKKTQERVITEIKKWMIYYIEMIATAPMTRAEMAV